MSLVAHLVRAEASAAQIDNLLKLFSLTQLAVVNAIFSRQLNVYSYRAEEIPEKCSRLLPGESCEVGCSSNYILQRHRKGVPKLAFSERWFV